jgi:non-canonical poly(A) RNA polymerase PAPD5/7
MQTLRRSDHGRLNCIYLMGM